MISGQLGQTIADIKMELLFDKNTAGYYIPYSYLPVGEGDIPTFRTDGRQIVVSQEFASRLTKAQIKGVFFHEIVHNVLGHPVFELDVAYPKLLKYAQEIAVNNIVLECGLELPTGDDAGIVVPKYKGWSTLAIYADLAKNPPPEDSMPQCGCCVPGLDSSIPEDQLGQKPTQSKVRQKLSEVEQQLKSHGVSGSLLTPVTELIRQLATPKLDWTEELRDAFIKSFDGEMLDYANPIKQYMYHDIFMPTYKDENIHNLFMAMDLSSSVTEEEIQKAQDILDDIRQLYSIENTVIITFNHDIMDRLEFGEFDEINFSDLDAGGGTCIDNVFEYIEQNGDSPFTLLIVSDMEDYIQTKSVPYPVIWLNTDERGEAFLGEKPNFGKLINVHEIV